MAALADYLDLTAGDAQGQFRMLLERRPVQQGRQVTFLPVETLLCLAASFVVNHRHFGGGTAHQAPEPVASLARLFSRPPSSVLAKMANLDGSRSHGARWDALAGAMLRNAGSDELLGQLRVLNGFGIDLAADQTRLANRLRDALTSVSPALERALERALGKRLSQAGIRDLLIRYPTLTALRNAGSAQITKVIKTRSPRLAVTVTGAVLAALDAQSVTVPAEAATGRVIAELAGELDRVLARRDALAGEIEEVFLAHPFGELLSTLPGIGPRTGSRILAEIGDGTRFADGGRLASYAGLAPVTRQSGKSINGESQSRRGNHRLKNAMFLAAFASLRDPASKAFHDRKRAEGKRHNAALMCLARRRCDVILAMLRTGQAYRRTRPAPTLPEAA